ncbi:MAG: nitroreductase family protein, partial [Promethearchaeota archaeon]
MDFYDVVKMRRSFRVFKPDIPEKEKVDRILNAARLAPTWANMQGMHYIVVQEPTNVKAVWEAVGQMPKFADAPMCIVGVISEKASGKNSNGEKYYG